VLRCHDFRSGREAIRSQYREYWQGERQSHGRKLVPAIVGRLGHIRDMARATLRGIHDFGSQRTRVSLC
jgi:hypothetical protein